MVLPLPRATTAFFLFLLSVLKAVRALVNVVHLIVSPHPKIFPLPVGVAFSFPKGFFVSPSVGSKNADVFFGQGAGLSFLPPLLRPFTQAF